MVKTKGTT